MQLLFSSQTLLHILEQSMLHHCVCPAQLCRAINDQRALYTYQQNCLNKTEVDQAVHERIAQAVEISHAQLEQCLAEVLRLEQWDLQTYDMPEIPCNKILNEFK